MSSTTPKKKIPDLNDFDVEILWTIVQHAQSLPATPFVALFKAYEYVLEDHHLEDSQSKWLRSLILMRDRAYKHSNVRASSLSIQLQDWLAEHGIWVEYSPPEAEDPLDTRPSLEERMRNETGLAHRYRHEVGTRRGSFSSFGETTMTLERSPPRPRRNSADTFQGRKNVKFGQAQQVVYTADNEADDYSAAVEDDGHVEHVAARLPFRDHHQPVHQEQRHPQGTYQATAEERFDLGEDDYSSYSDSTTEEDVQPQPRQPQPNENIPRRQNPSRAPAGGLSEGEYEDEVQGQSQEVAVQQRRATIETLEFFEALEERATRARDIFLLTKAFTHWAMCASDEVFLLDAARRHILRTRYFHAWRDTAAVYELKARRLPLKKFFRLWLARTRNTESDSIQAESFYRQMLCRRAFDEWLDVHREEKALAWQVAVLRGRKFVNWQSRTEEVGRNDIWAEDFRKLCIWRRFQVVYTKRVAGQRALDIVATEHYDHKLSSSTFGLLRRAALMAPKYRQLRSSIDNRILRTTLDNWGVKEAMYVQASQLNRTRLLNFAFFAWNDETQVKEFQNLRDQRLLTTILRTWITATRLQLAIDKSATRIKTETMQLWLHKTAVYTEDFADLAYGLETKVNERRANSLFNVWLNKTRSLQASYAQATQRHVHRLVFEPWMDQTIQQRDLEIRAKRARFWVLLHNPLKTWAAAAANKQKDRRRATYAVFRARHKRREVASTFNLWRERFESLRYLEQLALENYEDHIDDVTLSILSRWKQRTLDLASWNEKTNSMNNTIVAKNAFSILQSRSDELADLNAQAAHLATVHDAETLRLCLRRLDWALFQLRARDATAEGLARRNAGYRVREYLRIWQVKCRERRQLDIGQNFSQTKTEVDFDGDAGEAVHASVSGNALDGFRDLARESQEIKTPMPLRTPRSLVIRRQRMRVASPVVPATVLPRAQTARFARGRGDGRSTGGAFPGYTPGLGSGSGAISTPAPGITFTPGPGTAFTPAPAPAPGTGTISTPAPAPNTPSSSRSTFIRRLRAVGTPGPSLQPATALQPATVGAASLGTAGRGLSAVRESIEESPLRGRGT